MKSLGYRSASIVLALSALPLAACSQALANPSSQAEPPAASASAEPSAALPPINTQSLPPSPVPATFDVAALSDKVKPLVVNITTVEKVANRDPEGMDPFEFFFGPRGRGGNGGGPERPHPHKRQALGTGFIIDPSGYMVTNDHVVRDADEVRVRLADEREFKAEVVGHDPRLDVALLKIQGVKDLPAAPLGSSEQLRVGEHVLAVGNPFGLGHTVTLGIVSAKARTIGAGPYDDFIQTDASINPGNSGGPLFNWRGEVVGINTAIRAGANGIGFAIPVDIVKDILPQLRDKGRVDRGRLGLAYQSLTPDLAGALGLDRPRGALVTDIEPGGAAARAGIHSGDVVLAVNGTAITHAEELPRRVAINAPGSTVKVTILRDKQQRDVAATLDALRDEDPRVGLGSRRGPRPQTQQQPAAQQAGRLGVQISDAPGGGVRIDDVLEDNVRDLAPGDVIIEVNRAPVKDVAGLRAAMAKVKPGEAALFKVRRGRSTQYAAVPIPAK
jgi:serine protease Do